MNVNRTTLPEQFQTTIEAIHKARQAQYEAEEAKRVLAEKVIEQGWTDCVTVNMSRVGRRLQASAKLAY